MTQGKLLPSVAEAVRQCGLRDGMTISFHHHLRNGDYVLNMVMQAVAEQGLRDLTVNASSLFDTHLPLVGHIKTGWSPASKPTTCRAGWASTSPRG